MNWFKTDDIRIQDIEPLISPAILIKDYPATTEIAKMVATTRKNAENIISGHDDRLLVVVGPCSIHDPQAAVDYASRLKEQMARFEKDLVIIMRVYFEKPRTTVGWKGLINDPFMNHTFDINRGLHMARGLLLRLGDMGVPAATEFLDTITPVTTVMAMPASVRIMAITTSTSINVNPLDLRFKKGVFILCQE